MKNLATRRIPLLAPPKSLLLRHAHVATVKTLLLVLAAASVHAQTPVAASSAPAPSAPAATVPDIFGLTKPNWLTVASVTVKEGYDTNLFGVSTNLAGHPDIANVSSSFTTVSANLTFDLLAGSGAQNDGFFKTLTLAYAADYTAYTAAAREDNLRNTVTLALKGKSGPWTLSIENPFLYVYGSKEDQFFGTYNNLGYGVVRERRNQIQERNTSSLRYDAPDWFVRAVGNATYYNLLINEHDPVGTYKGYANWVNRDDINAGVDLGYKLTPDFAFVAGWRIGQQTQARLYYSLVDNDNTYNRALFGFEGKLLPWLQLQTVAGPDFRRYSDGSHSGITGDRHTWFYTQSQLTATFTSSDTLTASNKVWHFVSSAGLYSIQETLDGLTYKHDFSEKLSASVGVNIVGHRYDFPAIRNDWTRSYPIDVTYAFNRSFSVSLDYNNTGGHSHFPTTITPGQNFSESLVSLSVKASF